MKLRAFLAVVGYFAFLVVGASLSCQVAHAQAECIDPDTGDEVDCCSFLSLCDCEPDEFDTCYIEPVPPPPPDWTETCLKTEPHAALWGYTDVDIDSDGNLEAWAVAYNLDGVAGQVMPTAWLEVTMPDGTVVPEVLQGTWASPMISVSVDQAFTDYNDTGAGKAYGVSELHYNCGFNLSIVNDPKFGIATTFWGPPPIVDIDDNCHWANLACSSGTPRCTYVQGIQFSPGCPQYMQSETLVVDGSCWSQFAIGIEADGPGVCN